jgi:hypothetical protein
MASMQIIPVQEAAETIEYDKTRISKDQQEMINTLYDMYMNETSEAERQNLRV